MADTIVEQELHPTEERQLVAEFTEVLPTGETVLSAVVTAADTAGTAAPGGFLSGTTIATPKVLQEVTGSVATLDEDYLVIITATTTPGALDFVKRFLVKVRAAALTAASIVTSGLTANSYVTYNEAVTYLDKRLRATAWEQASKRDRIKALLRAVQDIDAISYRESRFSAGFDTSQVTKLKQPLAFPRTYMKDNNGLSLLAQEIKDAQCEQALYLLQNEYSGTERRLRLQAQGVASFAVNGMSETYRTGGPTALHPWNRLSPDVQKLLARHVAWGVTLRRV